MYFGVVPVFLLFLPFRLITGMSLTTYHATQVFVALFICGVFANFYMMSKRFFKKMTLGMYLMLASAFSIMSVWYSVDAPALYCTAITGALCMETVSYTHLDVYKRQIRESVCSACPCFCRLSRR